MSSVEEKAGVPSTVKCILCTREYDRRETEKYRPAGIFAKYCLCEDCLRKYRTSDWGWHQ